MLAIARVPKPFLVIIGLCLASLSCASVNSRLFPSPTPLAVKTSPPTYVPNTRPPQSTATLPPTATPQPVVTLAPRNKAEPCDDPIVDGGPLPTGRTPLLTLGTRYTAQLAQTEKQTYAFTALAGDLVFLRFFPKSGFNVKVVLITPGGGRYPALSISHEKAEIENLQVYLLDVSGRYLIEAQGLTDGEYELWVHKPEALRQLQSGDKCESQLLAMGFKMYYIEGVAGQRITVDARPQAGLDLSLSLYDDRFERVAYQEVYGAGLAEHVTFVPKRDGDFVLWVSEDGFVGGTFTVEVR